MTQLIINGTAYPQTSHGKYTAREEILGENITMSTGRMVTEVQARIWIIEYEYDYFRKSLRESCIRDLREDEINVSFLRPDSDELVSGTFVCTQAPAPSFAFSRDGRALWSQIKFTLREARGH